jgi:glycosyltransferase involved in cell wall biosynthesis
MQQPPEVLYLSFDGLLEPLGTSQVARPVCGLSDRGTARFTVISLEKPADLANAPALASMRRRLSSHAVRWVRVGYYAGSRGAVLNLSRMLARAMAEVAQRPTSLVHARSYLPGTVALALWKAHGVPYLFDFRGYWIDERIEENRWFTTARRVRAARAVESRLFREASGIVSLTALAAEDIQRGRFGRVKSQLIDVIPTCVDENEFSPSSNARLPLDVLSRLRGKLVIGYVGSLNVSYDLDAALALFREIRARRPDAHLLCVTRQQSELRAAVLRSGVAEADFSMTCVDHDQMPAVMNALDWGLLLLRESPSKRASMPTKLAEFLASGVRPIQFGCNSEVSEWVRRAGSGTCLQGLGQGALRAAAELVSQQRGPQELVAARECSLDHFALSRCLERYERLYSAIAAIRTKCE